MNLVHDQLLKISKSYRYCLQTKLATRSLQRFTLLQVTSLMAFYSCVSK